MDNSTREKELIAAISTLLNFKWAITTEDDMSITLSKIKELIDNYREEQL